jgi:hypothetical protein
MGFTARTTLIALVLVFAWSTSALAAGQRFASPTGSNTDPCSSAAPCDIVTAINGTGGNMPVSGDEVIVEQGNYGSPATPFTTPLAPPVAENIHGVDGQTRPRIFDDPSSGTEVLTLNNGSTARFLDIETLTKRALFLGSGSVDQVLAHARGSSFRACTVAGGVMTNSICWASGVGGTGIGSGLVCLSPSTSSAQLRNVVAYATGSGGVGMGVSVSGTGCVFNYNATNVIAHGGDVDVRASQSSGATETVAFDHSAYATTDAQGGAAITPAGSGTNISQAPALVDPANGDFHETLASPTADAGATDAQNGTSDFDGQARSVAGTTDIGADELIGGVDATAGAATGVGVAGATLNGAVNAGHQATTYSFRYGTTPAMASSTPVASAASTARPQAVTATIDGLPAGTTIFWALTATNASGTVQTAVQQFQTGVLTPLGVPSISSFRVSPASFRAATRGASIARVKRGARVSYTDSQAATTTFTVARRTRGVRRGRRCVARPRRPGKHTKRCVRYRKAGTFKHTDLAGANRFRFTGRIRSHALRPGRYRMTAVAVGATGKSKAVRASFRIVR